MRKLAAKRRLGAFTLVAAVAVAATLGIRQAVAQVYYVPLASMAPEVPRGARILVYKLAGSFEAGDIVAYRHVTGETYLGRVEAVDAAAGSLTVTRNGTPAIAVHSGDVIGRVVLSTR